MFLREIFNRGGEVAATADDIGQLPLLIPAAAMLTCK